MAAYRGGGGRYQAGRYSAEGRKRLGGIQVTFDAEQMIRLSNQAAGESTKIGRAVEVAHLELAKMLQDDIADVLEDKIDNRPGGRRVQGMRRSGKGGKKKSQDRLATVIRSEENRRVNQQGFSVGYLDEIPSVRQYYRGLEEGTSRHKGRYLSGVFLPGGFTRTKNGATRGIMVVGGTAGRFTQSTTKKWHTDESRGPYSPGVKIQNAIEGYSYIRGGQRRFIQKGGTNYLAFEEYRKAMKAEGLDLLTRHMGRSSGLPSSTSYGDTGF